MIAGLLRIDQWYKNCLVFLPIIFSGFLFEAVSLLRVVVAFIALCLVTSAYYIINDIIDRKEDAQHPEKKDRPIASGNILLPVAATMSLILFCLGISIGIYLNNFFAQFLVLLFGLSLWYSIQLKKIIYLDIMLIGINFVIRALSGALVIIPNQVIRISPWLIVCPFFLAVFLATAKRRSNAIFLGKNSFSYSMILSEYTTSRTTFLMNLATFVLLVCYIIFSFDGDYPKLVFTIPLVMYAILRFRNLTEKGSVIARDLKKAFYDLPLALCGILWAVISLAIIYL